jgi:hypothetical protein
MNGSRVVQQRFTGVLREPDMILFLPGSDLLYYIVQMNFSINSHKYIQVC